MAGLRTGAFKEYFMPVRADWNARGPYIPTWFRKRLKKIHPDLRLQFIPAWNERLAEGCNPDTFPRGVWVLCQKMKYTRWLYKQWSWSLTDDHGNYAPPTMKLVYMLESAAKLRKYGKENRLVALFDKWMSDASSEKVEASRARLMQRIVDTMSRVGMKSTKPRVFIPASMALT